MRILLVNVFHGGSHKVWADAILAHSRASVTLFSLPDRHWKWRMHGAAVQLSLKLPPAGQFDLMVVTDMLELATLRGLRTDLAALPTVVYFHENQLTYPWSPADTDREKAFDRRYGWINYTSALAATQCWFASRYHQAVFTAAVPAFLKAFPNGSKLPLPDERKFWVASFPVELSDLAKAQRPLRKHALPTLVWNHRWEYDKGPEAFFSIVDELAEEGRQFQLIVLGESFARSPEVFAKAKKRHESRVLHWGFAGSREEYESLLLQADIALVTSHHDFFGISVIEAIAAGAVPVLPARLGDQHEEAPYSNHLDEKDWAAARYENRADCLRKVRDLILVLGVSVSGDPERESRRRSMLKFDARHVVNAYDEQFASILAS